jgi:hypothetical protein
MKVLCQYGMGMGDVGSCLYNDGCYDLFVLNGRKFVFGTLKASLFMMVARFSVKLHK